MANWTDLKTAVAAVIKTNGNKNITGQVLQNTLNSIIDNLGENATFKGIATVETAPGTPVGNIFYIANKSGIYSNFSGIEIKYPGIHILQYDNGIWSLKSIDSDKIFMDKRSLLSIIPTNKLTPIGLLNFGVVDYVDNGTDLFIMYIQKNNGIVQVNKSDGTSVAQFYSNTNKSGIEELDLKSTLDNTTIFFRALVNWDLFDNAIEQTYFDHDLKINLSRLYNPSIKIKNLDKKADILTSRTSLFLNEITKQDNTPFGLINFGVVDYVADGTDLYLMYIVKNNGIIQVNKYDGTAVAQFYSATNKSGIEEVELKSTLNNITVFFKALVNWDYFDTAKDKTTFDHDLKIDSSKFYNQGKAIKDISNLTSSKINKLDIFSLTKNLFNKLDTDNKVGNFWIPSTSTTGNVEALGIGTYLTGFIPVREGDAVKTTLWDEPENWFTGYFAIFDENKQIITQPDIIHPPQNDPTYYVGAGESFVRIAFSSAIDPNKLIISVNERLVGEYISYEITNRLDLRKIDIPGSMFGCEGIMCGDSVTEFGTYPEQVALLTGAKIRKVGYGGCRMAAHPDSNYNELSMYKIANSINTGDFSVMQTAINNLIAQENDDNTPGFIALSTADFTKIKFLTVFFGTNDFTGNVPMGVNSDATGATFKGAINYTIDKILSAYPNIRLVFITPTHRFVSDDMVDDSDVYVNGIGLKLIDYVNAIIEVANLNHIPVLDLYRNSGLNKYNHAHYFGIDGVHPNAKGYTYLANKISAFLKSLFSF